MLENRSFDNLLGWLYADAPRTDDLPAVMPLTWDVESYNELFGGARDR
jgi:phospholipase C